jgi:hypothetical protein
MICLIEDAVIEKDTIGQWCCKFAYNIKGVNIKKLEESVIEKDITGGCNLISLITNID